MFNPSKQKTCQAKDPSSCRYHGSSSNLAQYRQSAAYLMSIPGTTEATNAVNVKIEAEDKKAFLKEMGTSLSPSEKLAVQKTLPAETVYLDEASDLDECHDQSGTDCSHHGNNSKLASLYRAVNALEEDEENDHDETVGVLLESIQKEQRAAYKAEKAAGLVPAETSAPIDSMLAKEDKYNAKLKEKKLNAQFLIENRIVRKRISEIPATVENVTQFISEFKGGSYDKKVAALYERLKKTESSGMFGPPIPKSLSSVTTGIVTLSASETKWGAKPFISFIVNGHSFTIDGQWTDSKKSFNKIKWQQPVKKDPPQKGWY